MRAVRPLDPEGCFGAGTETRTLDSWLEARHVSSTPYTRCFGATSWFRSKLPGFSNQRFHQISLSRMLVFDLLVLHVSGENLSVLPAVHVKLVHVVPLLVD